MAKKYVGQGTRLFYATPDASTPPQPTTGAYSEVECVYTITPAGTEYDTVEEELCLNDTTSTRASSPGDPVTDEISFSAALDPDPTSSQTNQNLEKIVGQPNWPFYIQFDNVSTSDAVGRYQVFTGYLRQYKPDEVSRQAYMNVSGVIVRTSPIDWPAAAPVVP